MIVAVKCPRCDKYAEFTRSNALKVIKRDIDKFKHFKVEKQPSSHGSWLYLAWHDPGINPSLENTKVPKGYSTDNFRIWYQTRGVVVCNSCDYRRVTQLKWPEMAYFKVDYKRYTLWAYNRRMALLILQYLRDPARRKRLVSTTGYVTQHYWLRKLPTVFQTKKATPHVVKKLEKLLAS